MVDITLISGSTLGSAEYVAEHIADQLEAEGYAASVLHGPELAELPVSGIWLVVTSTHGAGELPENLQPLFEQIAQQRPDLSRVSFGGIGIGSSEYDTFCRAIDTVDRQLIESGAKRIGNILRIDITRHDIPEDPASEWAREWIKLLK